MFWGLILEPGKKYSQVVKKSFHITHAAMDTKTGDSRPNQVMVVVDEKNFLMCTLQKEKTIQSRLDLYFQEGDSISFVNNGESHIHMTGYLDPEFDDDMGGEEEEDDEEEEEDLSFQEAPQQESKKQKRKLEDASPQTNLTKKQKKELKKQENKKKQAQKKEEDSDDSGSDDDLDLEKLLQQDSDEEDENDDSYAPDGSGNDISMDASDDDEDEDEDDSEESEEESSPAPTPNKQSKKQQQQQTPMQNGHSEKKKKKNDGEAQTPAADKSVSASPKEKKTLTGNVAIEDLRVGQGAVAKPGKTVQVYYEGKLKSNNKMFDSCQKGPGFKFRLGKKEVISGWDVGVAGMKVGGKRRIVCPPGMAYGNKGSPPVIPPNSTLVFEVELKGVN